MRPPDTALPGAHGLSSTVVSPTNPHQHQQQQQYQSQYGSMYPGGTQTPLPGQPPLNIQSQNFRPDPAFASLPQNQQQLQQQQLPMSAPPHQGRPHGMVPTAPPPPSAEFLQQQQPSKLMSAMASIPLIGSLFGKKQKAEAPASLAPGPPGRYDGQHPPPSTFYTRPTSGMSGYTSYTSHPYTQPYSPSPQIGPSNILEKIKGAGRWYFIPLVSFLMRESVVREIAPLVGRYAMRYPLIEGEERAAVSAAAQAKKGIVHAGGMRAVDAKEFRHAAPALRNSVLDHRLENIFVPRFSRLRKYRRAPEVWDDDEAHAIAQRVQGRMQA
ncbi:hypothetical protein IWW55_007467, partial [Coemansia sp. RSA 2706]